MHRYPDDDPDVTVVRDAIVLFGVLGIGGLALALAILSLAGWRPA